MIVKRWKGILFIVEDLIKTIWKKELISSLKPDFASLLKGVEFFCDTFNRRLPGEACGTKGKQEDRINEIQNGQIPPLRDPVSSKVSAGERDPNQWPTLSFLNGLQNLTDLMHLECEGEIPKHLELLSEASRKIKITGINETIPTRITLSLESLPISFAK